MAKSDQELDRVFREKLENYEAPPSPLVWDKLETQLPAPGQTKKKTWWAIAAAMPLLLVLAYLIWSQAPRETQENSLAATEGELEVPLIPKSTLEAEPVVSEEEQYKNSLAEKITASSSQPVLLSGLPQENPKETQLESRATEAVTFLNLEAAVALEVNSTNDSKTLLTPESTHTTPLAYSPQATVAGGEELDGYRIRIFSDGLKKEEAHNKNLITELGKTVGQVEGLFDKLDEGFIEIQERKNRVFSSLTSRKTPSIEKQ
jgi:hypothetical protein